MPERGPENLRLASEEPSQAVIFSQDRDINAELTRAVFLFVQRFEVTDGKSEAEVADVAGKKA
jgi:hypothetical protein